MISDELNYPNNECQQCSNCLVCKGWAEENKRAICRNWNKFVKVYVKGNGHLYGEEECK
ncbi:hypothetical protein [Pectinatus frisingensis]|uniref:hypothetical protein n=1 Tax=Pectinatus frisingensis TaxID=865 RepID=UPI0018C6785A|nr:hypothetical protein [Pectinatus frisingensis]